MNDDRDWEAEHDVHILTEAMEIQSDPSRVKRAQAHAKERAQQLAEQAEGMDRKESAEEQGFTSLGKMNVGDENG